MTIWSHDSLCYADLSKRVGTIKTGERGKILNFIILTSFDAIFFLSKPLRSKQNKKKIHLNY